jgi:hypothetical protein
MSKRKRSQVVASARRAGSPNRGLWIGGAIVVVVALVVVLAVAISHRAASGQASGQPTPTAIPTSPLTTANGRISQPPWPVPGNATDAVHSAGLPMLGSEGTVEHIHVHLDILMDGKPVTVPALVGIDEQAQSISPLHTHDTSGVIHIESPVKGTFSLGQFFTEWQVTLSADQLGGLRAGNGNELRAYVNGKQVTGNPAAIMFTAHDEIALVYGPADQHVTVPGSYVWQQGL